MLENIITKIFLGVSLAAPMGPVNAEIIKRGLVSGFWGAFSVRMGGAIANSVCLTIAYFGLGQFDQHSIYLFIISCIGLSILIYTGVKTIIEAKSENFMPFIQDKHSNLTKNGKQQKNHSYTIKNGILIGLTLAFTSPIGLMFWLSTFATTLQQESNNNLIASHLLINYFIIVGVLLWGALISFLSHLGGKMINRQKLRIISYISGLILIYFGIKYGIQSFNNVRF